jgi:hypothetical protein
MSKIRGPVLLGFGDFFEDSVGAKPSPHAPARAPGRPPARQEQAKRGKPPARRGVAKGKSPHKAALFATATAGKHALAAAKGATDVAAKYDADVKAGKHGPLVKLAPAGMKSGQIVLGVDPGVVLNNRQRAAVAKHTSAIARHAAAARRAQLAAKRAQAVGRDALAWVQKTTPVLKARLSGSKGSAPAGRTAVHGVEIGDVEIGDLVEQAPELAAELAALDDESLVGALMALGVEIGDATTDGSASDDSSAYDSSAAPDAGSTSSSGVVTAPDGTVLYDPSQDPGVVAMPTRDQPLGQDGAQATFQAVPDDGIPVPGGMASVPRDAMTSYGRAYQGFGDGYYWLGPNNYAGDVGQGWARRQDYPNHGDNAAPLSYIQQYPYGPSGNWGPIVGKPDGPLPTVQFAYSTGTPFFQSANAPSKFTQDIDSKIAEANAKTIAANTAAAQAQAAQMAADAAAAAEAKAKQDADNALQESAAQSQANVAATQQQSQQSQLDLDTQRAALEQSQQEAKIQAQAQQAIIDQANVYNAWAKSHPDEAMAEEAAAAEEEGGGEEGAGEGEEEAWQEEGEQWEEGEE